MPIYKFSIIGMLAVVTVPCAALAATSSIATWQALAPAAMGPIVRGTGAANLIGMDRTDVDDVHDETMYAPPGNFGGFNATFFASEEASFGAGEAAFNVFGNTLGGGNNKWCCGTEVNGAAVFPLIVGADFGAGNEFALERFTVSSSNDSPLRDPRVWSIEGSNDGSVWEEIFSQNDPNAALWTARDQVIQFDAGTDFPVQTENFQMFRMVTDATGATSGAFFALGEIELFGNFVEPVPEPGSIAIWLISAAAGIGFVGWRRRRKK